MDSEQFMSLLDASNAKNNAVLKTEIEASIEKNNVVLKKEIQEGVKKELTVFKEDIKEMVTESLSAANEKIAGLEHRLLEKDEEIAELRIECNELKNRTLSLDFTTRNKNIILFKVAEVENESQNKSLLNGVCKMIREIADPSFKESDVNNIYRMGKDTTNARPIMLKLMSESKRSFLLSQKRKFMLKKIGVAEDLPKEVVDWRKPLYQLADALRKEGKKVMFRLDKLIVEGVELSCDQIESEQKRQLLKEQQKERKRGRSVSPPGPTTGKRVAHKLNLRPATPKSQPAMEHFFSPSSNTKNSGAFEYTSLET